MNLPAFYRAILGDAAAEILRDVSCDLDRGAPATAENWQSSAFAARRSE